MTTDWTDFPTALLLMLLLLAFAAVAMLIKYYVPEKNSNLQQRDSTSGSVDLTVIALRVQLLLLFARAT